MSKRLVVWVDAGHGGKDPGNVSFGVQEKTRTIEMARRVAHYLKRLSNGEVVTNLTRVKDEYISVNQRASFLRSVEADVLVSLHTNASLLHTGKGAEVLIDPRNDRPYARKVAAKVLERLTECGLRNRGVKRKKLAVLTAAPVSILVEMGFADNTHDAALLNGATSREVMAIAIARGILEGLGIPVYMEGL